MVAGLAKRLLVAPLRGVLRAGSGLREGLRRLHAHSALAADLQLPLPSTVVILGRAEVHGTARILFSGDTLLYPGLYLETQESARITLASGVVLSRGVHLVAMAGIHIGCGTMIGEYTSVRDANHTRKAHTNLRESAHVAKPIHIGDEVWIGRGVAVLAGVTIGDGATVGANAVVTRDVPAGGVVGGVPARPLHVAAAQVRRGEWEDLATVDALSRQ